MDKHEKDIKSFGMLQDYNDSEEFLSKHPDLTCDATAGYLALWCINLEVQEVTSLSIHGHQVHVILNKLHLKKWLVGGR